MTEAYRMGYLSRLSGMHDRGAVTALVKSSSESSGVMSKIGKMLSDEARYIREGISSNPVTRSEALGGAALGALSFAAKGALLGLIPLKNDTRRSRRRRAIRNAIIGGLIGSIVGPAAAQYRRYMAGKEYSNDLVDIDKLRKGDKLYIGVSGSANGQDYSWFADEMSLRFPRSNYMLRHVDGDRLEKLYDKLKARGVDVRVIGHSSGGKTAARFLERHPEATGYLIDPVSWLGRRVPDNAIVFTSDIETRHGGPIENYIADAGGRWNYDGPNSVVFRGSHSNRLRDILRDFVKPGIRPGQPMDMVPEYVSSLFGNATNN